MSNFSYSRSAGNVVIKYSKEAAGIGISLGANGSPTIYSGTTVTLADSYFTNGSTYKIGAYANADGSGTPIETDWYVANPGTTVQIGSAVNLTGLSVSFTLPAHSLLSHSSDADVSTLNETSIRIWLSQTDLYVEMYPAIHVGTRSLLARNYDLSSLRYTFVGNKVTVDGQASGGGIVNPESRVEASLETTFRSTFAGTTFGNAGYNPLNDQQLQQNFNRLAANWKSMPSTGNVSTAQMTATSVGASFTLTQAVTQGDASGQITIATGVEVSVTIAGTANVAQVQAADGAAAAASITHVDSVSITSEGITLSVNQQRVANLEEVHVARGGAVTLTRVKLLDQAAADGQLLQFLVGWAGAAAQGAPPELAAGISAQSAGDPKILAGLSAAVIGERLSEAVRTALLNNSQAYPGVNIADLFGVSASPAS